MTRRTSVTVWCDRRGSVIKEADRRPLGPGDLPSSRRMPSLLTRAFLLLPPDMGEEGYSSYPHPPPLAASGAAGKIVVQVCQH
jgi:hypothetical protein